MQGGGHALLQIDAAAMAETLQNSMQVYRCFAKLLADADKPLDSLPQQDSNMLLSHVMDVGALSDSIQAMQRFQHTVLHTMMLWVLQVQRGNTASLSAGWSRALRAVRIVLNEAQHSMHNVATLSRDTQIMLQSNTGMPHEPNPVPRAMVGRPLTPPMPPTMPPPMSLPMVTTTPTSRHAVLQFSAMDVQKARDAGYRSAMTDKETIPVLKAQLQQHVSSLQEAQRAASLERARADKAEKEVAGLRELLSGQIAGDFDIPNDTLASKICCNCLVLSDRKLFLFGDDNYNAVRSAPSLLQPFLYAWHISRLDKSLQPEGTRFHESDVTRDWKVQAPLYRPYPVGNQESGAVEFLKKKQCVGVHGMGDCTKGVDGKPQLLDPSLIRMTRCESCKKVAAKDESMRKIDDDAVQRDQHRARVPWLEYQHFTLSIRQNDLHGTLEKLHAELRAYGRPGKHAKGCDGEVSSHTAPQEMFSHITQSSQGSNQLCENAIEVLNQPGLKAMMSVLGESLCKLSTTLSTSEGKRDVMGGAVESQAEAGQAGVDGDNHGMEDRVSTDCPEVPVPKAIDAEPACEGSIGDTVDDSDIRHVADALVCMQSSQDNHLSTKNDIFENFLALTENAPSVGSSTSDMESFARQLGLEPRQKEQGAYASLKRKRGNSSPTTSVKSTRSIQSNATNASSTTRFIKQLHPLLPLSPTHSSSSSHKSAPKQTFQPLHRAGK